jgi:hypothetical protein
MIVRESEWRDTIPAEQPTESIVRACEDGSTLVYRPGCAEPLVVPPYAPRYAQKLEAHRG